MAEFQKTTEGERGARAPAQLRAQIPYRRRVMQRVVQVLQARRLRRLAQEALTFEADYRLGY